MKLLYLILIIVPSIGFSQQNTSTSGQLKTTKSTPSHPTSQSGSSSNSVVNSENNTYPMTLSASNSSTKNQQPVKRTLEQINQELSAIETKTQFVKSDSTSNQQAIDQGWFEQMETYKNALLQQKQELLSNQ